MESVQPDQTFTSADRIRQLNDIDKDVAKLIESAGLAIQALSNAKSSDASSASIDNSLASHKARFKEATSRYFALLSSIDVRLRRQVYALEEAGILAPDTAGRASDMAGAGGAVAAAAANPLEISWLNSRKDTVGMDKEAEVWAAAREFVEKIADSETTAVKAENATEKMELD